CGACKSPRASSLAGARESLATFASSLQSLGSSFSGLTRRRRADPCPRTKTGSGGRSRPPTSALPLSSAPSPDSAPASRLSKTATPVPHSSTGNAVGCGVPAKPLRFELWGAREVLSLLPIYALAH
uniref:Uncharacterized protein n=1 Tax=Aegilops tauschii subsp. strangulata TaxID=200361 RepID=A0A453JTI7_AEGTS